METIDLTSALTEATDRGPEQRGHSQLAQSMKTSEILTIAYDVRDRIARGEDILNLTVGDFNSQQFPVPDRLSQGHTEAFAEGHSNYPPAPGVPELREAVRDLYERRFGLKYPVDSVLIAGGARPFIAGVYLSLINEGDEVVFGLPSWNNHHYAGLVGAKAVEITTSPDDNFFLRVEDIKEHIPTARMLVLNTPQNPTGTVMPEAQLREICELVVAENKRRVEENRPALYLLFDQIYWLLTFEGSEHKTPVELVPEMAPYTIMVDGVSKGFAATGVRVGWCLGPIDVIRKMTAVLTHLGCWAPRPGQIACAKLLADDNYLDEFLGMMRKEVGERLQALSDAVHELKAEGHPVDAIAPQGAIYLSMHFALVGKKTKAGKVLENDEDIRCHLLAEAGIALVPFRAFGCKGDNGWFRASVGVLTREAAGTLKDRLTRALAQLS